jgi:hypothetical protein
MTTNKGVSRMKRHSVFVWVLAITSAIGDDEPRSSDYGRDS